MFWLLIVIILATVPALLWKKYTRAEVHGPLALWKTKKTLNFVKTLSKHAVFTSIADLGIILFAGIVGTYFLMKKKQDKRKVFAQTIIFLLVVLFLHVGMFAGSLFNHPELILITILGGYSVFAFYNLLLGAWITMSQYFAGANPKPLIQPIIPGVSIPGAPMQVPLSAVIGLVIVIIVHEWNHAIAALREKIRVKSVGIITLGLFPIGAFAEPDEKHLKKTKRIKRMRVFAAGSAANFLTAVFFFMLLIPSQVLLWPVIMQDSYVEVLKIEPGSPAEKAGLTNGTRIYNIKELLETSKDPVFLVTDKGNYTVQRNASGMIGIIYSTQMSPTTTRAWASYYFLQVVFWTGSLNVFVGIFNLLPLAILDGALLTEDVLAEFFGKKKAVRTVRALTWIIIALLLIGFLPYFVK